MPRILTMYVWCSKAGEKAIESELVLVENIGENAVYLPGKEDCRTPRRHPPLPAPSIESVVVIANGRPFRIGTWL